jgi:hypothetical protein
MHIIYVFLNDINQTYLSGPAPPLPPCSSRQPGRGDLYMEYNIRVRVRALKGSLAREIYIWNII